MYGLTLAGAIHTAGNFGHRRRADPVLARQARPNPSRARLCLRLCHADSGWRGDAGFSVHGKIQYSPYWSDDESGLHRRRHDSRLAKSTSVKLEKSALLLDVLVLCGIAGSGSYRARRANQPSCDKGTGLDGDRCDVGACHRDWLCPHRPISTGFGIATGSGRCNNPA